MTYPPRLDFTALEQLANDGGYNQSPLLSSFGAVLLLSAVAIIKQRSYWENKFYPISDSEYRQIVDMIDDVEDALINSSYLGTIISSVAVLNSDNLILLNGTPVLVSDYPELSSVVPSDWIVGGSILLPDMSNTFLIGEDSNVGDYVGENTVTLEQSEMPVHTHIQQPHTHDYVQSNAIIAAGGEIPTTASLVTSSVLPTLPTTAINNDAGGGMPHNNIPQSLSVYRYIVAR